MTTPLLEASGISKKFGGVTALRELSLAVDHHSTVGLIGPNGAGKTTLFNCLFGLLRPDTGRVSFDGQVIDRLPIYRRARLGIGRTYQRLELFREMTVGQHLLAAERSRRRAGGLLLDLLGRGGPAADELARVQAVLELLGIAELADVGVEALSLGHGRLVELGRALATEPALLMLDEPSSGLDRPETASLAVTLGRVNAERGTAILLVEHDVELVRRLTSRLYVLDFGQLIASGPTADVLADAAVRRAYLGPAG
ncbi:MAG TPA: ABC transporter ATP-binding protein [Acidimicrobiales bacterium]|nr:ABC transporter ATP-binding protein [Acidimicrobiales bacterium]